MNRYRLWVMMLLVSVNSTHGAITRRSQSKKSARSPVATITITPHVPLTLMKHGVVFMRIARSTSISLYEDDELAFLPSSRVSPVPQRKNDDFLDVMAVTALPVYGEYEVLSLHTERKTKQHLD